MSKTLNDTKPTIEERTTDLLLILTNSYFDLLAQVSQQKRVIAAQGSLINQCMERIMTLEGRSILGDFNQRLEQLEANKGTYYAINKEQFPKMLENVVKRVDNLEMVYNMPNVEMDVPRERIDALESWLYTHDYNYFQEEENKTGNSSFEDYEQGIADNAQLEELGTHPPNCRCPWCEPQEGDKVI